MAHFLQAMLRGCSPESSDGHGLRVKETGAWLATDLRGAFDSVSRRKGLLGREAMPAGFGMVIAPCSSVHTAFMRFAIDLVFAARSGRVLKVALAVPPWRVRGVWRGFAVVELAAGQVEAGTLLPGMHVEVHPRPRG